MRFPNKNWFERYGKALHEDPEWSVIGKFFNCTFMIESDDERCILSFYNGKLVDINDTPLSGPLYNKDWWEFAVRAPNSTWEKYMSEVPPAKYHHFFAVTDYKTQMRMRVEGNLKTVWQNIRALTHAMEFLRVYNNNGGK